MVIHPSEMYMLYGLGSMIVVKSVDGSKDKYLRGHSARVNYLAVSKQGNLFASGEVVEPSIAETAALIVWDFNSMQILYRVRFHKQMVMALSFNCDERLMASVGGARDGNQLVVWNMKEGKSEAFVPASSQPEQECYDLKFFNSNPNKLATVHHNSVKVWTFEPATRKIKSFDCALGKINRYIICLSIDDIDEHAFCGTRSGDILEVSLSKGIFNRSGPINKKFSGAINQVLVKSKSVYAAVADGTFAKLDKATLTVAGEQKYISSQVTALCESTAKVYCITSRGDMRSVSDSESIADTADFMCGPSDMIAGLSFHSKYCGVFASCSQDEIRLWSPDNCRELLRIELMQGSEFDFAASNCVEFTPDGKAILSGWTDGKIRCFTP